MRIAWEKKIFQSTNGKITKNIAKIGRKIISVKENLLGWREEGPALDQGILGKIMLCVWKTRSRLIMTGSSLQSAGDAHAQGQKIKVKIIGNMYTTKEDIIGMIRNTPQTIIGDGLALNPEIEEKVKVGIPKKEEIMIGVIEIRLWTEGDDHVPGQDIGRRAIQVLKIINPPGVRAPGLETADQIKNLYQGGKILSLQIINIRDDLDPDIEIAEPLGVRDPDKMVVVVFDLEGLVIPN